VLNNPPPLAGEKVNKLHISTREIKIARWN